ncbi:S8 family serine peptidase [Spirillospora sp. NPDC047279]|uniref:S8 family serine peptidase n=1 Tax=Spirillospora sp. NPDC047279 TaxID=3155478 RepID=UPI0033F29FF5
MTRFLAAAGAGSMLALTVATPAGAVPGPRSEQWWFSAWEIQKKVWPVSQGAGVTVAVIDTGVNASLPEFQGAVVPGADLEGGSGGGRTDTDTATGGHGTGMAALIASQGGRTGFVGVAPQSKIMPLTAKSPPTIAKAIRHAADNGAKVVSISQGFPARGGCQPDLQQAVGHAIQKDVVVVVSAGNQGNAANPSNNPANCAGVLAVGAVDNKKNAWVGTQRQPYVAVAAPGAPVTSVGRNGALVGNVIGTSQAAALTSGVAALVRSKNPQMSNREVVQRIIASAVDAGPPGKDNMTGAGVVIPERALTATVPKSAPNPVFDKYDQWAKTQGAGGQAGGSSAPVAETQNNDDRNSIITLVIAVGAILAVVLVAVIILFVVKRKSGGGRPPSGGGGYGGGGYGGGPGQQAGGPPPGWGAGAPQGGPGQSGGYPRPPQGGQGGGYPTPPQGPPGQQGPPPGYRR